MSARRSSSRVDEMRAMREANFRAPLERKTPLGRKPRSKGNRGELAIIKLFAQYGWKHARRNWQSGGQGGGDILEGPVDCNHEVKNQERLNIWAAIAQSEEAAGATQTPIVWFKRSRSRWYAALPAEDLLAMLQLRERENA